MADLTTTHPMTIRRSETAGVEAPRLSIGATLVALSKVIGQVFDLAYVAPYSSGLRQGQSMPADGLEGRDPGW